MAEPRLVSFIERALESGKSREEIAGVLRDSGWSSEQINEGLAYFAAVQFPIAVPRPKAQLSARDAFAYLLMFSALYVSCYQLGNLLYQFIEIALPDDLDRFTRASRGNSIRWAVASLIVAFPVFLIVARRIHRELQADATRRASAVRKWLTYLTLFVAAGVLAGDAIALIYNLLGGELTSRFVLKALVVAMIAGSVFGYYLRAMQTDDAVLAA